MVVQRFFLAGVLLLAGACGETADDDRLSDGTSSTVEPVQEPARSSSDPSVETTGPSTTGPSTTGPSTIESSTGDIQLDVVSIQPASPAPGQVVEIVVSARAPGLLHQQVVSLGDGRTIRRNLGMGCSTMGDYAEPPPPPIGPTEALVTIATTYRASGDYSVGIDVEAYTECPQLDQGIGRQIGHLSVPLSVAAGPSVGNGDLPPSASLTESIGWGGTDVRVEANGTDDDGWISELRIDWGDNSTPTTITRNEACAPGPSGWPMNAGYTEAATHTYPAPGEYTATLTVTSTACDGTRAQTASSSNLVVFPSR